MPKNIKDLKRKYNLSIEIEKDIPKPKINSNLNLDTKPISRTQSDYKFKKIYNMPRVIL